MDKQADSMAGISNESMKVHGTGYINPTLRVIKQIL